MNYFIIKIFFISNPVSMNLFIQHILTCKQTCMKKFVYFTFGIHLCIFILQFNNYDFFSVFVFKYNFIYTYAKSNMHWEKWSIKNLLCNVDTYLQYKKNCNFFYSKNCLYITIFTMYITIFTIDMAIFTIKHSNFFILQVYLDITMYYSNF